jgi:hypothetical protein
VAAATPCYAGPGQPTLPQTFGAWTLTAPEEATGAALEAVAGDNFAVFREFGLDSAERGIYIGAAGAQLRATLYRLRDASSAYGAYTFLRTPEMAASDLAEKSAVGREHILVVIGSLLLDLSEHGAASLSDLKALVEAVQTQTAQGVYPTLWQYLPAEGFRPTSDHYLLGPVGLEKELPLSPGDWLGFTNGAEAELARYRVGRESVTLLLAMYPTPQAARQKLEELGSRFRLNPESAGENSSDKRPALFAARKGLMLALVAGAQDVRAAQAVLNRVKFETSVTWNTPSWRAKEPPFLLMVVDIFIWTGILILYALGAGIVFGLVRLLIKRLLPGRVFDRDANIEILQLGLGSKPIEAKDFYTLEPPA